MSTTSNRSFWQFFSIAIAVIFILGCHQECQTTDEAEAHGVLLPPDGKSHRGDKMVGDKATAEELKELSERYKTLTMKMANAGQVMNAMPYFENQQEYFLRLLDYYLFSKNRLVGMTRREIEDIFGSRQAEDGPRFSLTWRGGRDTLKAVFENGRVKTAMYSMGF